MDFLKLKKEVLEKTPYLRQTLEKKGDTTLLAYFEESLKFSNPVPSERQEELLQVVKEMIEKLINYEVADNAMKQLQKHYYASTADHHGPITHPFFVNSHLAQSFANKKNLLNTIFVFSCGGISLNNSSFPRGILFHNEKLEKKRLRFASLKNKHHPVFGFPAYTKSKLEIRLKHEYATLPPEETKRLQPIIDPLYQNEKVYSYSWYSDQISQTNYRLWKKIPGQENVNLIYLEQENIAAQLLLTYHLKKETLITRLLTDESTLEAFELYFDGIQGAFSTTENRGTTLFWAIHKGKRTQLKRKKNILESTDGSYQIELTPKSLTEALQKKELMPSMALSFIVLSFYHGLTCGGGFLQVNYATEMKEAYLRFLKKIDEETEQKLVSPIKTDYFCGEFVFATIGNKNRTAHASSIDLMLYGNSNTATRLQELAEVCTLGEAIDMMMPQFYKILYGKELEITLPPAHFTPTLYV